MHIRRRTGNLSRLIHHSGHGMHYLAVRYSERLADSDIIESRRVMA